MFCYLFPLLPLSPPLSPPISPSSPSLSLRPPSLPPSLRPSSLFLSPPPLSSPPLSPPLSLPPLSLPLHRLTSSDHRRAVRPKLRQKASSSHLRMLQDRKDITSEIVTPSSSEKQLGLDPNTYSTYMCKLACFFLPSFSHLSLQHV